jgi:RNA polymerase-binding transcription factor DksA
MNNETLEGDPQRLRDLLLARRAALMDDLQRRLQRIRQTDMRAISAGEGEDGDPSDIEMSVVEIMNATVRRIDAALVRLAEGRYGRCAKCRAPISEARLRAMPFAVCCHRCETRRERTQPPQRSRLRKSFWDDESAVAVSPPGER